jgi:hypothetical protein
MYDDIRGRAIGHGLPVRRIVGERTRNRVSDKLPVRHS